MYELTCIMIYDKISHSLYIVVVLPARKYNVVFKDLFYNFGIELESVDEELSLMLVFQRTAESLRGKQRMTICIFDIARFPKTCYPVLHFVAYIR